MTAGGGGGANGGQKFMMETLMSIIYVSIYILETSVAPCK